MGRIKEQLILSLLSLMLVSGIFVDPNIAYASEVMEMSQHDMHANMSCVDCAVPRDMQDCARHCLQQTSSHLNDFRFIHQTVSDDFLTDIPDNHTTPKIKKHSQIPHTKTID